jgi:hypothetical protein
MSVIGQIRTREWLKSFLANRDVVGSNSAGRWERLAAEGAGVLGGLDAVALCGSAERTVRLAEDASVGRRASAPRREGRPE